MLLFNCANLADLKKIFFEEDKFFTDIKILAHKKDAIFVYNTSNFCVQYTFKDILKENTEEEVTINKKIFFNFFTKVEKNFLEITPNFIKTKKCFLKIEQKNDFLQPPSFKSEKSFFINRDALLNVKHACAQIGYSVLRGVNISPAGVSATDGNRLCIKKSEIRAIQNVTLSFSVVQILENLKEKEAVKIEEGGNKLKISTSNLEIITNKYAQNFPEIEQLLKFKHTYKINLNKKDFLEGCNLLKAIKTKENVCKLQIDTKNIYLKDKKEDFEFNLVQNLETENAKSCTITFNLLYILDMLNNAENEDIEMLYTSNYAQILFKTGKNKNDIIMPIKV